MDDAFELTDARAADTADMTVMHPATGEPTRWVITFAGPGHAQTIALAERQSRRRLAEDRLRENAQVNGRKYKAPQREPDEIRAELVGDIVARMVGWTGLKTGGVDRAFSADAAREILADPAYVRVLDQCIEFLTAERSFMTPSATAS